MYLICVFKSVTHSSLCSYIFLVLRDHVLYLFTFENIVPLMRLGFQWCGAFHYHWWTTSKTEAVVFPCRLCFRRAVPFISLIMLYFCIVYPWKSRTYERNTIGWLIAIGASYQCVKHCHWRAASIKLMRLFSPIYLLFSRTFTFSLINCFRVGHFGSNWLYKRY